MEADDLTMAIQAHATFSFVQPPPQDVRASRHNLITLEVAAVQ